MSLHFAGICVIILSIFGPSYCLDCYACNVSSSTLDEEGCYGIGAIRKCPGNSVCLAATYEIKSGIVNTYTTMQSCFPDMAGTECENFFKSQKDLHRSATVTPSTCYSCSHDNCNKSKSNAGNNLRNNILLYISILIIKCFLGKIVVKVA